MVGTIRTVVLLLIIISGCFTFLFAQMGSLNSFPDENIDKSPNLNLSKTQGKFFAADKDQHLMGSLMSTVFLYKVFTYLNYMYCDPLPCEFNFLEGVGMTLIYIWNLVMFIIIFIVVYIIWSLIQKKK